jgi:alpha-D-xyloside xylohydrolase
VEDRKLVRIYDSEILQIEAWGNGLRVRATCRPEFDAGQDWALLPAGRPNPVVAAHGDEGSISTGDITAKVHGGGRITFFNARGDVVLEECWRTRAMRGDSFNATEVKGRELRPLTGGAYKLTARFEARDDEKIFGMGQYQDGRLDLKGCLLELAHRNSQASVPFFLSNRGYGFLWNNPAIGRATFGMNMTEFAAEVSTGLDYWITAGDTPALIEERYAEVTGTVPMMPDFAMGFWQCKLRYKTQAELLAVAREYKKRGLPISVIVADFFHWPTQGEWKFDPRYWPDPDAMVKELKDMGIELMVSIWPTVDKRSENYRQMLEKGYLVRSDRGIRTTMDFMGNTVFFDPTNPAARDFVWRVVKENYYDKGIRIFWLDEAEPEYSVYDFDTYRYHEGSVMEVGNFYPVRYAQTFYDGMRKAGQKNIINLLRCAWAGSQRYGALAWSGDINCTWQSLRRQFAAGLNMAIAGIPWWTTDIGGFEGGDPDDPAYRELFVRWFQWGAFCPVFRLHGFRVDSSPQQAGGHPNGDSSEQVFSGGPNEVWSYGEETYGILTKYLFLRERMRPYVARLMKEAHEKGTPVMRPLFYDFPADSRAWDVEDEYMFGPDVLVAPVMSPGIQKRSVYLPSGAEWKDANTGEPRKEGEMTVADSPLDTIPIFLRKGADVRLHE